MGFIVGRLRTLHEHPRGIIAQMSDMTTREIENLIALLHSTHKLLSRGYSRRQPGKWLYEFNEQITCIIGQLHDWRYPARRSHTDYLDLLRGLIDVLFTLVERSRLQTGNYVSHFASGAVSAERLRQLESQNHHLQRRIEQLEVDIAAQRAENDRLRLQAALRPVTTTAEVPAKRITVQSDISQAVLAIMAQTGLTRSWRIIEKTLLSGAASNRGSVQNALTALTQAELLQDFQWQGRKQGWKPAGGRDRRLIVLSERGKLWYQQAFERESVPEELHAEFVRRHDSVTHAVGILEAADHLHAAGYQVDMNPAPLLAGDARWGRRSEPDLMASIDGRRWPVEVQREVHARRNEQWGKTLEIEGRLLLILFSEDKCNQQLALLQQARRGGLLPAGEVKLSSLEAMESAAWHWLAL